MQVSFGALNAANAVFSFALVVITALVGLYYAKKASRANLHEAIDDLQTIASAKDEQNHILQRRLEVMEVEVSTVRDTLSRLEGHNQWLLTRNMLWEQYVDVLTAFCVRSGLIVPPRPPGI